MAAVSGRAARVVVMGVSGCGKTTVSQAIASRTGWPALDADDLHSPDALAKMTAGIPLTDDDRWPWLGRVAGWLGERQAAGEPAVIACSALKRTYRDRLREADPDLRFVYLRVDRPTLDERLSHRVGHFFPKALLDAQLDDLDEPGPDERPIVVHTGQAPAAEVDEIVAELND